LINDLEVHGRLDGQAMEEQVKVEVRVVKAEGIKDKDAKKED